MSDDKVIILRPPGFGETRPSSDFSLGYNKGYAAAKHDMRDAWDQGYEAGLEAMRMKLKEMGIEFHFGGKEEEPKAG
jgi:hypothetical protein